MTTSHSKQQPAVQALVCLRVSWVPLESWPQQMHIHCSTGIAESEVSYRAECLFAGIPKDMNLNSRWAIWDMTIETGDAKL